MCQVAEFQGLKSRDLARACLPCANKKGCRHDLHPFSFFYSFIISVSPSLPAKLCDFIFLADSLAYAENRRNGGLTRFRRNREAPQGFSRWQFAEGSWRLPQKRRISAVFNLRGGS